MIALLVGLDLALLVGLLVAAPTTTPARDLVGQWVILQISVAGVMAWWYFGRTQPDKKPADASSYGSHGTARFAKPNELRSYLKEKGPGLILGQTAGRYLILPSDTRLPYNQNVTVIGGSGTRKTRTFVQPNILQTAQFGGESLIVIDPKGENYGRSAALLKDKGYEVHVLNFLHMENSDRWNPLDAVTTVTAASDLAMNLVANTINPNRPRTGDPFWDNAEQAFITALVLYVKNHRPAAEHHMASVLELGTELMPEALDQIFRALPNTDPARRFYRSFMRAEEKVRGGVVAGLGSRLRLWNSPEIVAVTAASDFKISDFGTKQKALFLVIPDSKATFASILALFWQQVFETLYQTADDEGGTLPVPVRCRMDEIANCGYIPDYEKKKSTMRSRGISTEEIWQSLGQIKARYPTTWAELLSNSDHMLFLGTNDLETAQYISQKLGQMTIRTQSTSSSQSDRSVTAGRSDSYAGRPLLTPDEVMRLPPDEALLIPRAANPVRVTKPDFSDHPLVGEIRFCDHKQHRPPQRQPAVVTDVTRLLRQSTQAQQDDDPPPKQPAREQSDLTHFVDQEAQKKKEEPNDQEAPEPVDPSDGGSSDDSDDDGR